MALKFLPAEAASNQRLLERFHGEVRVARVVSHPNVCRVYDIGEAEGMPFLSMEYVDGEDLASLLLRIGRLPADKALQTARKICAGLATAHDRGVIHRDLKPHNIMMKLLGLHDSAARWLFAGAFTWLLYLALEPSVRSK